MPRRSRLLVLPLALAFAAPATAGAATCAPYWSSTPGAELGASGFTGISASAPDNVWAVGKSHAGETSPVAHFDGTTWSLVSAPPRLTRDAVVALAPDDVWASGRDRRDGSPPSIDHFNGTSWSSYSLTRDQLPYDLAAIAPNDVWGVGGDGINSAVRPLIEHWNGTQWSAVAGVDLGGYGGLLYAVAGTGADDVWAGGSAGDGAATAATLVQHWDGSRWTRLPFPVERGEIRGLAAVAPDDVWAVGRDYATFWTLHQEPLIAHWDGTSWESVTGPAGFNGYLEDVSAVSADDIWAVGGLETPSGSLYQATLHWDGTSWHVARVGVWNKTVDGVSALADGTIFAAGGALQQLCEIRVSDDAVAPSAVTSVPFDSAVAWHFGSGNAVSHSVTDASGLGLFDSGLRGADGSFSFVFAAGTYRIADTSSGHMSTIAVATTVSPASGTTTTAFSLAWASTVAPSGYVYDVQMKRPGATAYADVLVGTRDASTVVVPDAGAGTYAFRARVRNTGNGSTSGWSLAKTITVGP